MRYGRRAPGAETAPVLAGRTVAVTGAARGIGAAVARALAAQGARVAVGDLDPDAARALASELSAPSLGARLDVTDTASFSGFLDETERVLGRLDVLVCNAGVMWVGALTAEPESATRRQLEVNLHGVIRGFKLAAPRLGPGGHLVVIASAASRLAPPGEATYAATKHGVYGYAMAARRELARRGVHVSVVMPGVVATELAAGTSPGRGTKALTVEDVAEAVLDVLRRPRFEAPLPRAVGGFVRLRALAPQRLRDALDRAFVPDQLSYTDPAARAAYERAALSQGQ